MRRLWINADDFGLTPAVSAGIACAMLEGNVCTTSAMMCRQESREEVAKRGGSIRGRIGLHLQLTDGTPLSQPESVPALVDKAGNFARNSKALGRLNAAEVLREWRLQLAAIRALGFEPTHIDTHHDVHWQPGALEAYIELAREENLPVRGGPAWLVERLRSEGIRCAAATWTFGDRSGITLNGFMREVEQASGLCQEDGFLEIACHPGYVDEELHVRSKYVEQRRNELGIVCSPELPERLLRIGVEIASFAE